MEFLFELFHSQFLLNLISINSNTFTSAVKSGAAAPSPLQELNCSTLTPERTELQYFDLCKELQYFDLCKELQYFDLCKELQQQTREVYFKTLYIATIGMTSIGQPLVGCVQYIRSSK